MTRRDIFDLKQVIIRPAVQADLPTFEWEGEYAHFRRVYASHYKKMLLGETFIWVAEDAHAGVIGQLFVLLKGRQADIADGQNCAYIFSFRILSQYRNKGLGTQMMAVAENDLRQRGFKYASLNVAKTNAAAKKLYEKLGYSVIRSDAGEWKFEDQFGRWRTIREPAWHMQKQL